MDNFLYYGSIIFPSKKETEMNDPSVAPKGTSFNLEKFVDYASGSVVSKTLLKRDLGNITLFSFDKGPGFKRTHRTI